MKHEAGSYLKASKGRQLGQSSEFSSAVELLTVSHFGLEALNTLASYYSCTNSMRVEYTVIPFG